MAKAGYKSSTIDWISLSEALELTAARFQSEELAKELLREWRASGKLPGACELWKEPDAALIAWIEQLNRMGKTYFPVASTAHHKDDPEFWRVCTIDWKNNMAYVNAIGGAKALGEKVSRTHLDDLLAGWPREREETPEPTDAEVPAPSANAPAASPVPPRKVSEADLRQCLLDIVKEHPPDTPPLDEETLIAEVERRLGASVSRDHIRRVRNEVAPDFKLPQGRPRKSAQ